MTDFVQYLQSINDRIVTIEAIEAIKHHKAANYCFVDLRDSAELEDVGMIPGAQHCPRGSLEFRIPVSSTWHSPFFSSFSRFVFYCSHGQRSILATDTAQKMGLENVCHIKGGMKSWTEAGGELTGYRRES